MENELKIRDYVFHTEACFTPYGIVDQIRGDRIYCYWGESITEINYNDTTLYGEARQLKKINYMDTPLWKKLEGNNDA